MADGKEQGQELLPQEFVKEDSKYKYDFNIIYSRDDPTATEPSEVEVFVEYLVNVLEKEKDKDTQIRLNGFYPKRDMLVGQNLIKEHFQHLNDSRYSIVVLDKSLLENKLGTYFTESAFLKLVTDDIGSIRLLPFALNISKTVVEKKFTLFNCQEVLYFNQDYKSDDLNWNKVKKVVTERLVTDTFSEASFFTSDASRDENKQDEKEEKDEGDCNEQECEGVGMPGPSVLFVVESWGLSKPLDNVASLNKKLTSLFAQKIDTANIYSVCTNENLTKELYKEDKEDALSNRVTLLLPPELRQKTISHIVGYTPSTYVKAIEIKEKFHSEAELIMVNCEIPCDKPYFHDEETCEFEEQEAAIIKAARQAKAVFSLGHKVYDHYQKEYAGDEKLLEKHKLLWPYCGGIVKKTKRKKKDQEIVSFGPIENKEDISWRGLDIISKAIGRIANAKIELDEPYPIWTVRGCKSSKLVTKNLRPCNEYSTLYAKTQSTSKDCLNDLDRATMCLLSSPIESFEMVGIDVILSGIPMLVASGSGLARLMTEIGVGRDLIVNTPVGKEEDQTNAIATWKKKILQIMKDPNQAKQYTQNVFNTLSESEEMYSSQKDFISACGVDGIDLHVRPTGIIKESNTENCVLIESLTNQNLQPSDLTIERNPNELARLGIDLGEEKSKILEMTYQFFFSFLQKLTDAKTPEERQELCKYLTLIKLLQSDGKKLIDVKCGSIIFTLHCPTIESLDLFWQEYTSGQLKRHMEALLITNKVLKKYHARSIELKTTVSEQEYNSYKDKLSQKPKASYERQVQVAEDCYKRGESRNALFMYQKAIITQRSQGYVDYVQLSSVYLKCSKIWFELESFQEAVTMVDQSLDLYPAIEAYKLRAEIMRAFHRKNEALRSYLDILSNYTEDGNEHLFLEVVYAICDLSYRPEDYNCLDQLQEEYQLSPSLWENALCKLAREENWYQLYRILRVLKNATLDDIVLNIDYTTLLKVKRNWVPKLIFYLLKKGASIKCIKTENSLPEFLFKVIHLSGNFTDLFDHVAQYECSSVDEKNMLSKESKGTLLHLLCQDPATDWWMIKKVLDYGVSPWMLGWKNHVFAFELMDKTSENRILLENYLKENYREKLLAAQIMREVQQEPLLPTADKIGTLLKSCPDDNSKLQMAVIEMIKFAAHYGASEEKLSKLACTYVRVVGVILDVLDTDCEVAESWEILPNACSQQVANELIEDNLVGPLFKLLTIQLLPNVTLKEMSLSNVIEQFQSNMPEVEIISYINKFVTSGADVNKVCSLNSPLRSAINKSFTGAAVFLIENNADLENNAKMPLIHIACDIAVKYGNFKVLQAMLVKQPDCINAKDESNNNILHHLARFPWTQLSDYVMKLVCTYMVNPFQLNGDGVTPRQLLPRKDDQRIMYITNAKENYHSRYPSSRKRSPRQKIKWLLQYEGLPHKEFPQKYTATQEIRAIGSISQLEGLTYKQREILIIKIKEELLSLPEKIQSELPVVNEATVESPDQQLPENVNIQDIENLPFELQMNCHFMQQLKKLMQNPKHQRIFLKSMKELGTNPNNVKNTKKLILNEKVFSSMLLENCNLIWMLSVGFSPKYTESVSSSKFADIVQCLALTEDTMISDITSKIEGAIKTGKQYRYRKLVKAESEQQVSTMPTIYHVAKNENTDTYCEALGEFDSSQYSIQKFYPLLPEYLHQLLINMDKKVDIPFVASEKEYQIIKQDTQCAILLLGRSGTGKTTCCFRRLWENFIQYWFDSAKLSTRFAPCIERKLCYAAKNLDAADQEQGQQDESDHETAKYDHLQQIFVTKNAILVSEAEKIFQNYCHTYSYITRPRIESEALPLPQRLQDIQSERYPLFLTSRQLLLLLDASLPGESFFFDENYEKRFEIPGWTLDNHLTILTDFDQNNDIDDVITGPIYQRHVPKEVSSDVFELEIWPRLKTKADIDVHPSLIWTEILSFIKGSESAMKTTKGYLTLEEYKQVGKKQAVFSDEQRESVYSIFLEYQKILETENMFDEAYILYKLNKRCNRNLLYKDWCLHELYVDETQDFTQAELSLLLNVCQNPNKVFLTGDTAQTIMKGTAFRFQELTTMFHGQKNTVLPVGKNVPIKIPRVQYLMENYRSHDGILNLAAGVVKVMQYYFSSSFDKLPRDVGALPGPKPIILEEVSPDDLAILLRGNANKASQVELGANQAVLVVNDKAREELPEILQAGIVLTIYEAKGLEFDDVLLYNFFHYSSASADDWDVIRGDLEQLISLEDETLDHGVIDIDLNESIGKVKPPPNFDAQKHKILNSDLKYLYTAITRAKKSVWIYDDDEDKHRAMYTFFKKNGLVEQLHIVEDQSLPEKLFAHGTSSEQWNDQGEFFMKKKLYKTAKVCFIKGKSEHRASGAAAYMKIQDINNSSRAPKIKKEEYLKAAQLFIEAKMFAQAARCLYNGEAYDVAGSLFKKLGNYGYAAEIFSKKLHKDEKAVECYILGDQYREALNILIRMQHFDEAVELAVKYRTAEESRNLSETQMRHAPTELQSVERLCYQAASAHFRNKEYEKMTATLDNLGDYEAKRDFLVSKHMIKEATDFMEKHEKFSEAAKLCRKFNKLDKALDYSKNWSSTIEMNRFKLDCIMAKLRMKAETKISMEEEVCEALKLINAVKGPKYYEAEVKLLHGMSRSHLGEISKARKMYAFECPSYLIGAVYCTERLMEISKDNMNQQNSRVLSQSTDFSLETAHCLHSTSSNFAIEVTRKCEEFYGVTTSPDNRQIATVHLKENPRLESILRHIKSKETIQNDEYGNSLINRQVLHKSIIKDLLEKSKKWSLITESYVWKYLGESLKCPYYAAGYDCPIKDCQKQNYPYTRSSHQEIHFALVTAMRLENAVNKCISTSLFSCYRMEFQAMLTERMYKACDVLWDVMFPTSYYDWSSTLSKNDAINQIDHLRNQDIALHINNYADDIWRRATQQMRQSNTSLFVKVQWLYQMANNSSKKIKNHLQEMEESYGRRNRYNEFKQRIPRHVGLLYTGGSYCSIMRLLLKSTEALYNNGDPVASMNEFVRFLSITIRRGKEPLLPEIDNILPYVEFMSTIAMVFILRFHRHNKSHHIFIPTSYISLINLFDSVFVSQNARYKTYKAIHLYPGWDKNFIDNVVSKLKEKLLQLVSLLLGHVNEDYNVVQQISTMEKYKLSGTSERFVILLLVLLINGQSCDLPIQIESQIREELRINSFQGEMSSRLEKLLAEVQAVELENKGTNLGICGIAEILAKFCHKRDNEFLYECIWRYDDFSGPGSIKGLSYKQIKYTDLKGYNSLPNYFRVLLPKNPKLERPKTPFRREVSVVAANEVTADDSWEEIESDETIKQLEYTDKELKAAEIIIRFFRQLREKSSDEKLTNKLEREFTIDSTMCRICGESFVIKEDDYETAVPEDIEKDEPQISLEHSDTSKYPTQETKQEKVLSDMKQEHLQSMQHKLKAENFESFCVFHQQEVRPAVRKADKLIKNLSEKNASGVSGDRYVYDIQRLKSAKSDLIQEVEAVKDSLSWDQFKVVKEKAINLQSQCRKAENIAKENEGTMQRLKLLEPVAEEGILGAELPID